MKIIEKSSEKLVLHENNRALFFVGCALIVGGIVASLSLGVSSQPWWYGAIGVVAGIFFILVTSVISITFDKSKNLILTTRKSMLQKHQNTYPLDQVVAIELRFDSVVRSNPVASDALRSGEVSVERPTYVYKLIAVLKDGQEFFITTLNTDSAVRVSVNIQGAVQAKTDVQDTMGPIIAGFLGVPYQKPSENPEAKFFSNILQR